MKNIKVMAAALSTIMLGACSDSEFDGFKKADNGLHYRFFNQDENGTKVQDGDGIYIRYVIMNHKNDSVIVDSKNVSKDGSGYTGFGLNGSTFKGSLEDGFMMMAKGDSAEFIVPADSFFLKSMRYNELPPGFSSGDHLRALIKIKDITPKAEIEKERKEMAAAQEKQMMEAQEKEKPALEKYIADKNIKVKPTESGVYYIETKKGSGPTPKATDVVTVHYTGRLLDGTEFDSSVGRDPAVMPLNQFIPGWSEGVQLMRKGGKATLIVPSSMAYGPQGTPGGPIPPFATLVFDIELIDFTSDAGAGQRQPPPQGR
jgi:FKBP-type peptidyl-prolyl cis-trans isomerase FkpA